MNWWLLLKIGHCLTVLTSTSDRYLLKDDVFFAIPDSHQRIDLANPDTLLLDLSLFHATNEARRKAGLPVLQYDHSLSKAASGHARFMIRNDVYGHENYYQLAELNTMKRVQRQNRHFYRVAENIGQYQTVDTPEWFSVRYNAREHRYVFFNSETGQLYQPYTYAQFARYALSQWVNSPHHRENLLNPLYTHVGCAGRLSVDPFLKREGPYGRLVQNFGSFRPAPLITQKP